MKKLVLTATLLLAGCISTSVTPMGQGRYMVEATGGEYVSRGSLLKAAHAEADKVCRPRGYEVLDRADGGGGFWQRVKDTSVVFQCVGRR